MAILSFDLPPWPWPYPLGRNIKFKFDTETARFTGPDAEWLSELARMAESAGAIPIRHNESLPCGDKIGLLELQALLINLCDTSKSGLPGLPEEEDFLARFPPEVRDDISW